MTKPKIGPRINAIQWLKSICPICKVEFTYNPIKPKTYCSKSCVGKANTGRVFPKKDLPTRFWSKVNKAEGDSCWEWMAYRSPMGYGRFMHEGRAKIASRMAWELTYGPIPDALNVLHKCDNPPCVRPDHLKLGTDADNIADIQRRGTFMGKRKYGRLTEEQVRFIRNNFIPYNPEFSGHALAKRFNVHPTIVWEVLAMRTYKDVLP